MSVPKCLLGVLWTSSLIALAISTIMFSVFDVGSIIETITENHLQQNLVLKSFIFMASLIWLILFSSVLLNCFYMSLRNSNCGCATGDCDTETDEDNNSAATSTS